MLEKALTEEAILADTAGMRSGRAGPVVFSAFPCRRWVAAPVFLAGRKAAPGPPSGQVGGVAVLGDGDQVAPVCQAAVPVPVPVEGGLAAAARDLMFQGC